MWHTIMLFCVNVLFYRERYLLALSEKILAGSFSSFQAREPPPHWEMPCYVDQCDNLSNCWYRAKCPLISDINLLIRSKGRPSASVEYHLKMNLALCSFRFCLFKVSRGTYVDPFWRFSHHILIMPNRTCDNTFRIYHEELYCLTF